MQSWWSNLSKRLAKSTVLRLVLGLALLAGVFALVTAVGGRTASKSLSYTELVQLSESSQITEALVEGERFTVKTSSADARVAVVGDEASRHAVVSKLAAAGVPVRFDAQEPSGVGRIAATLAPVFVALVIGGAVFTAYRRRSRGHFASFRSGGSVPVHFSDVAGMDEVKEALSETVEFLQNPQRFGRLGGRAPRGVLLTGEPGTGKTLLARAVATEAGVPFLSASGSSFQEVFVGVGASRVRSLFVEARRVAPCIVFIDEIDAVGRARGRGGDSAAADADQTLNQLLVEMDGFDHTTGIVVVASTNRPDVLDPALLRPGRFDRQVVVPLPDLRGRSEILAVHARPIAVSDEVDLGRVARSTPGFSGAELANLLNEAAILAAREGADAVASMHIDRARDLVMMGAERKGMLLDPEERHATAVHEAGHVAVVVASEHADPVHKVSILPRGRALGVTQALPERDRLMYKREYLEDQICMLMGGRAAEMEILGTMTAGASDDIQRAASIARKMVAELGMSGLGPIGLTEDRTARSPALLDRVEEATRSIVEEQLARARRIVEERSAEIATLVERLLEHDTLEQAEILSCFPNDQRSVVGG